MAQQSRNQTADYLDGQVLCENIAHNKATRRFVERRIRDWLLAYNSSRIDIDQDQTTAGHFFVKLEREGDGHMVGCHIEMQLGSEFWIGSHYAPGVHQALKLCLDHMTPEQIVNTINRSLTGIMFKATQPL